MANPKFQKNRGRNVGASLEMAQFLDAGANKIKRRIRDIERLLQKKRDILPDTVIIDKERTLEALKLELENASVKQTIKKNSKKYHMIKFFERKKAMRKFKNALKELEDDEDNKKKKKSLKQAKIDLCYIVNFPKTEKYIALYPNNDDSETTKDNAADEKANIKKQAIRDLIEKQMKEKSLPVSFEDILKGKKLDRDGTGISLEDDEDIEKKSSNRAKQIEDNNIEEEEDDFFE